MTIGDKIYELRTSRNMSLREFANLTGVTHTTIARLEATSFVPQKIFLDTLYQICKKLNYDFAEFLIETGYIKKDNKIISPPTVPAPSSSENYSDEERNIIASYRKLPEALKKLVRDQLEVYGKTEELLPKNSKKV